MTEDDLWRLIQDVDRNMQAAERDALIRRCGWCGCQNYGPDACRACGHAAREVAA